MSTSATATSRHGDRIAHQDALPRYSPPDHQGTVNVRLVDGDFCGAFEMNLGTVVPGGEAEPHLHETEHQVFYILEGQCEVTLGDDAPVLCGAGTVVRIPPKLLHRVVAVGEVPMKGIIIYSPPLGPRDERPVQD
jgi:mannose-6-phosphate isomerase-like protein (cupin superfamily)